MCAAPDQAGALPPGVDLARETVLAGRVLAGGAGVGGAFVRLLDSGGEFTAEVVSSPTGDFRFFAGPGSWTVRALHRSGSGTVDVVAHQPGLHPVNITVT